MNKRILSVLLVVALLVVGCIFAVQATETETETEKNFVADVAGNDVYAASLEMDFGTSGGEVTMDCPVCNKEVTWKPLNNNTSAQVLSNGGHFYAASDINKGSKYLVVTNGAKACVHLNGKTIEADGTVIDVRVAYTGTADPRTFTPASKGTLNVMGSGTVIGGGTTTNPGSHGDTGSLGTTYGGSTAYCNGTMNLYGGTWKHKSSTTRGSISVNHQGTLNIYEGTTFTAEEGTKGRHITVESGYLNVYGGVIEKGDVTGLTGEHRYGGNILLKGGASYSTAITQAIRFNGGIIRDGKANNGGNIAILAQYGTNPINTRFVNCLIDNGQAVKTDAGKDGLGGNVYVLYSKNPSSVTRFNEGTDLTVSNGKAESSGGNIYFYQAATSQVTTCHMILQGGDFLDGQAQYGGNIYVYGAKGNFYIGGGSYVSGGRAEHVVDAETGEVTGDGLGGNLYFASGTMTIQPLGFSDNTYFKAPTIIDGYAGTKGGNIYLAGGTLTFQGGTISGGEVVGAQSGSDFTSFTQFAGNLHIAGGTFKMTDTEATYGYKTVLTGGTGTNGGNVYMDGTTAVLDIQGGIIENGYASGRGNNIYLRRGEVKFTGGEIRNNTTEEETGDFDGNSIYVGAIASTQIAQVTIGGDVVLNAEDATSNIYMNNQATGFVVADDFTGDVRVTFAGTAPNEETGAYDAPCIRPSNGYYGYTIGSEYVKAAATAPVWKAEGAYTGKLTMVSGSNAVGIFPEATETEGVYNLVTASIRGATFVGEGEEKEKVQTWYPTMEAAIAGGDDYIALFASHDVVIPAEKTVVLNINSHNVTASGEGNLTFFDANSAKGKVTVTGNVSLVNNSEDGKQVVTPEGTTTYLTVKNDDDTYSSYKLSVRLSGVSLRPSNAGIYFRGAWDTQLLPANIKNYGVVVSLAEQPTDAFKSNAAMAYTEYTVEDWDSEEKTGVLITGIFKEGEDNASRGKEPIYAASYAVVNNGVEDVTIIDIVEDQYSMYSILNMMEDNETVWAEHGDALNAFFSTWADGLDSWEFDKLGVPAQPVQ